MSRNNENYKKRKDVLDQSLSVTCDVRDLTPETILCLATTIAEAKRLGFVGCLDVVRNDGFTPWSDSRGVDSYDIIYQVFRPETDEEYNARIKKYEAALQRRREAAEKRRQEAAEAERRLYEELKKKYESPS